MLGEIYQFICQLKIKNEIKIKSLFLSQSSNKNSKTLKKTNRDPILMKSNSGHPETSKSIKHRKWENS